MSIGVTGKHGKRKSFIDELLPYETRLDMAEKRVYAFLITLTESERRRLASEVHRLDSGNYVILRIRTFCHKQKIKDESIHIGNEDVAWAAIFMNKLLLHHNSSLLSKAAQYGIKVSEQPIYLTALEKAQYDIHFKETGSLIVDLPELI